MRILMLNYEFPPLGGGAANANLFLLKEFSNFEDLTIDLITSSPKKYEEESFSDNIKLYKMDVGKGQIHYWTQKEILRYSKSARKKAEQLIVKNKYDLIHAWFGVPCGYIARKLGLPYIVSLRGSDVPGFNVRFSPQYIFLKPIIRGVWRNAEKVVANSEGLKNLARNTLDIPIDIIYNGVDINEFTPQYNEYEKLNILCVSRLIKRKGIEYLIEGIRNLDVELTIVGEGTEEENLNRLCSEIGVQNRVHFVGYVPHDKIKKYYTKADIYVQPSLNEGMSNTVLEAMASGLPIITTDTGGTMELIKENGIVVPMKDPEAIKKAVIKYVQNRELVEKHGRTSREIAEGMSWSKTAEGYLKIYTKIITKGNKNN